MQVYGTLEVININSLTIEYTCVLCKGSMVTQQVTNPYCFSCNKAGDILKNPSLQAKITLQDDIAIIVLLSGVVVDKVLGLPHPFLVLYETCLNDLKCTLLYIRKVGFFTIDN